MRLEPNSSLGYAMAAMTYWWEVFRGLSDSPEEALNRAVELAREALRLHDTSGYPHLVLAHTHLQRREFDKALAEANKAKAEADKAKAEAEAKIKAADKDEKADSGASGAGAKEPAPEKVRPKAQASKETEKAKG